tara:strand:- start:4641 stop:4961 length:321 start_codon:yes stop_codon:yes gene_type:complete
MADVERGISNNQKAQVLLDILNDVPSIDAKIDEKIKKAGYKAHPNKVKQFKNEIRMMIGGGAEVKKALGVSFKTLAILQKTSVAKDKVDKRQEKQMSKMLGGLIGG